MDEDEADFRAPDAARLDLVRHPGRRRTRTAGGVEEDPRTAELRLERNSRIVRRPCVVRPDRNPVFVADADRRCAPVTGRDGQPGFRRVATIP